MRRTNKLALIIIWLALFLGELPDVIFDPNALITVLIVWGLGMAVLLPATIIYFRNRESWLIRYFVSCGAVILVYSLLLVQKGALEDLYWIPVCLVASAIFFDEYVAIVSTLLAVGMAVLLYYFNKQLFFPALNLSQFIVYCISLLITGVVLVFQNNYGKRLIAKERKQSEENIELYSKVEDTLANIETISGVLDQNINNIKSDALTVKDETIQITSSIQQFSAAVEQTAILATESNSALTAIKELIRKTAQQSEKMINSSGLAYDAAKEGRTIINDLVNQIRIAGESVTAAGEIVAMLSVESKKINDIAAFINDITRKTNLLALNASIEASRAGAVGEGFMVVAGEMKSFAEQTAGALSGITQILRDLTEKIDQVGNRVTNGETAIRMGIEKTDVTQECFINIINKTGNIKTDIEGVISDISTLTNESTVVFSNLADITRFTEESVATMQELTSCSISQSQHINNIEGRLAGDLVQLSDELKSLLHNREKRQSVD
jgi:methyl-accepting chemotaxis protein